MPIYGFCRFYAHGAAYRTLLDERNLPHHISMSAYVVALIIAAAIGPGGSALLLTTAGTTPPPLAYALPGAAIAMEGTAITMLQHYINLYWRQAGDGLKQNARLGKGELLVVVIGIVLWAVHIAIAGAAT